jgi:hypothetical protein
MKEIEKSRSTTTSSSLNDPSKEELEAMSPREFELACQRARSGFLDDFGDEEIGGMTREEFKLAREGELKRTPAASPLVPPDPKSSSLDLPQKDDAEEGRSKKGGEAILAGDQAAPYRRKEAELEGLAHTATQAEPIEVGCGETIREGDAFPSRLRDTLNNPTLVAADASEQRSPIASKAGVLEMALDAAMPPGARNGIEKRLADQLDLAYKMAIRFGGLALTEVDARAACIALKMSTTAMRSYQQGVDCLTRLQRGGRQIVTVQRVSINEGGKAVIAGHVNEPAA